jgi:hypothetical protein
MLSLAATIENSMSKTGLDNRHRNHDGENQPQATGTATPSLPEEYDERVRLLALYPLRFLVLRSSKPTIISPTR